MAKPHIGDFLKEEGHRVEITQAAAAAGTAIPKKFEEARLEEIDRVIDVICFRLAGSAWQEGPIGIFEEI